MVAKPSRQHLKLPIAPLFGALVGFSIALLVALTPGDLLEDLIVQSGLPAILPAAEPPLGATARLGLALVGAGGTGLISWLLLFLMVGSRAIGWPGAAATINDPMVPVLRRADAHPDAPPRRPLFASKDLGTPFLEVLATESVADPDVSTPACEQMAEFDLPLPDERPPVAIPDDLDQPLAAFDPDAIPQTPLEPPVSPRATPFERPQVYEPGERFETFEVTSLFRPGLAAASGSANRDPAAPRPNTEATIAALLERLERSVTERTRTDKAVPESEPTLPLAANQGGSIDDTLGILRRMATRVG